MSSFLAILRNLGLRAWTSRFEYALYGVMLLVIAQIAIFVALPSQAKMRVAMVGADVTSARSLASYPGIEVTHPARRPDTVDVAMGRVDAIVRFSADGSAAVTTARSPAVAAFVSQALASGASAPRAAPPPRDGSARGTASTLMGIWLMFLLIAGVFGGRGYVQDKERRILPRIANTPIRVGAYLGAQGLFTFLLCLVPPLLIVSVEGFILGNGLGLGVASWTLVLACTAALASAVSLLVNAVMPDEDQAASVASMAALFTTLLSGSFIAPAAQGRLLRGVSTIMPQRAIMDVTAALESGGSGLIAPLSDSCWRWSWRSLRRRT